MPAPVTVAIPTRNAGSEFEQTLAGVRSQRLDRVVDLLICDSGSSDETLSVARRYGARMIHISPESFSHGGTRNLLMSEAHGDHVAFLTQDAVPAGDGWLAGLLAAFKLAPNVGLTFGPYRPRPDAPLSVRRELATWFDSFAENGARIDTLEPGQESAPAQCFRGHLGFFTDANGCVARRAWQRAPFRHVAYAEDHLLAQDMLRAGFAKVYVPDAAVIHSHAYSLRQWMRRSFDEARAVRYVYDWVEPPRVVARNMRGNVIVDWRWARRTDKSSGWEQVSLVAASLLHHGARAAGELLGSRADRLPARVVGLLSLEGRR